MTITWRAADKADIHPCLSIQTSSLGNALIGSKNALRCWESLLSYPFFASAVLEANPAIHGHHLVGFGASVFVSRTFADAEIGDPRPDINSRIMASIYAGKSVLADRKEVAVANAGGGVDVVVLSGSWRYEIMTPLQTNEVQRILPVSFVEWLAGYRIRSIHYETSNEPERVFAQSSIVYIPIADFPALGRVTHLMTSDSVTAVPGSLGNVIFSYRNPILQLRDSDQQLLRAGLTGATDGQLETLLGVSFSAIKARWRSIFSRIANTMPNLVEDDNDGNDNLRRGVQKRHRVLAYVRAHPEELRPFDWKSNKSAASTMN